MAVLRVPQEFSRRILDIAPGVDFAHIASLWARIYHYVENLSTNEGCVKTYEIQELHRGWNDYIAPRLCVPCEGMDIAYAKNDDEVMLDPCTIRLEMLSDKFMKRITHIVNLSLAAQVLLWNTIILQVMFMRKGSHITFTLDDVWLKNFIEQHAQGYIPQSLSIVVRKKGHVCEFVNVGGY